MFLITAYLYREVSRFDTFHADGKQRDAAIILGQAIHGKKLSPALQERVNLGLSLYQQGKVSYLIVTGGIGYGDSISEAEAMRNYLVSQGVPTGRILMETKASSTKENLAFVDKLLESKPFDSYYLVTHAYHMNRALEYAAIVNLPVVPAPAQTDELFLPYHKLRECAALVKLYLLDR